MAHRFSFLTLIKQSCPFMTLPSETLSRIINPPPMHRPILGTCQIRTSLEDFQVEEIPAYQPTGTGEHAYLWIEKRGVASPELVSRMVRQLGVPSKDIGLAGQKDRYAVTRQFASVPKRFAASADKLNSPDVKVLLVTSHQNKLKTGHLKANRFRLVVRNPESPFSVADVSRVQERLLQLAETGLPNYFGPQRFGHGGNTVIDGLRLLHGKLPRDHWPEHQSRTLKRLALSAVQSAVFNLVVAQRVIAGTIAVPQPGDVVIRREGTKPYLIPDGADASGVVPAGPMPGPEMLPAGQGIAEMESAALKELGLQPRDFERFAKLTSGVRRKMLEFPADVSASLNPDSSLELAFTLSPGTYATIVLQELAEMVIDVALQTEHSSPSGKDETQVED
jgi:tRNA pseudouridine13 synthase